MKISIIDIGSNSVRLMTWADGTTLYKRLVTTRLGEGIASSPFLREEAMKRTADAVAEFCGEARAEGAAVYAFATAAVRCAENGGKFCALVYERCGLEVDVVTGEEEAELALAGALGDADGAVIDIGGASTEICVRENGQKIFSVSLNVGAVRLFDGCRDDEALLSAAVNEALVPLCNAPKCRRAVAVGGTATSLAAYKLHLRGYEPNAVQDCVLTREEVRGYARELLHMSVEERIRIAGIENRRAEVVAGGAFLLGETMERMNLEEIRVSERDNLEGYLQRRLCR